MTAACAFFESGRVPRLLATGVLSGMMLVAGEAAAEGPAQAVKAYAATGSIDAAARAFEDALETAESDDERLATAGAYADFLSQPPEAMVTPDPATLERAAALYREVMAGSRGEDRLAAHNNYATVLLRLGRPGEAVEALANVEEAMQADAPTAARPLYFYNFGRALEEAGRADEAARRYAQSLSEDARFAAAADALLGLAFAADDAETGIGRMRDLLMPLIEQRALKSAGEHLRRALQHEPWRTSEDLPTLLAVLVRYFTAATVGPAAYEERWHSDLVTLEPTELRAVDQVAKIEQAYLDDLEIMLDPEWARYWWDVSFDEGDGEFGSKPVSSALVMMIGDEYVRLDVVEQALPRYVLAWNLDRDNGEAGVQMVNTLLEWPERLDPDGSVLDELIVWLFEGKGDAYLGQDWHAILRFHTLLGTIFERREQWGPRENPRSALFQWEHALEAQKRLLEAGYGEAAASPGLHAKIAAAYEALGDDNRAGHHYAQAAEGFLAQRNDAQAEVALTSAADLDLRSAEQVEQFGALREALNEVSAARYGMPLAIDPRQFAPQLRLERE